MALPARSPAVLRAHGTQVDVVVNDDGRPRVVSFAAGPIPANPATKAQDARRGPAATAKIASGYPIPCAIAGDQAFCPDDAGAIHRATLGATGDQIVATSQPGTLVSAALWNAARPAIGYLASRKTSEGWVREAWLATEGAAPLRLSESGAGATSIVLASSSSSLVALTLDARAALTAMHLRQIADEHGAARLGEDFVVFVGGPSDGITPPALALSPAGPTWALFPTSKDASTFGLALVRIDEPPRVDEPVVWSAYPNGLDPSPVATAVSDRTVWVARVRPQGAEPDAPRVVELGEIRDADFVARYVVDAGGAPYFVSLVADEQGALWIAWCGGFGGWLERVMCR